jgi:hypothetical protein
MRDNFKTITDAFEKAGIDIMTAEYSITEYSLNTDLSFKFENLQEFFDFLEIDSIGDEKRKENLKAMVVNAGVDTDNFFYVNFYKPKVAEL